MEKTLIYLLDKGDAFGTNNISPDKKYPDSIINLIMSQHKKFSKIYLLDNELVMGAVIKQICCNKSKSIFDKITIIEREDFELDLTLKLNIALEKVIEDIDEENHLFFYFKGDEELEETLACYVQTINKVSNCSIYNLDNGVFKSRTVKSEKIKGDIEKANLVLENKKMREELLSKEFSDFIGESKKILDIKKKLKRIKKSENTTVLITGETGTGKEVVARWIMLNHDKRKVRNPRDYTFVIYENLPKETINGSLFGELKGSHAGAKEDKDGIFITANKKILFLDEIGDLHIDTQPMLLRAIGNGEIQLTGSSKPKKVDVMFITATNKNIKDPQIMRPDLYARLDDGADIMLPPLRERKKDIPLLINYLLEKDSEKYNWRLSSSCLTSIAEMPYSYPSNIRSLTKLLKKLDFSDDFEGELEWSQIAEHVEKIFRDEALGDDEKISATNKIEPIKKYYDKKTRDKMEYNLIIETWTEFLIENKRKNGIHPWTADKLGVPVHKSKNFKRKHKLNIDTMLKTLILE